MLSSSTAGEECNYSCNRNSLSTVSSSSSSSSSSTSSSSRSLSLSLLSTSSSTPSGPFSPSQTHLHQNPISTKTMEEVWKDINLASLNDQNTRPSMTTNSTFGGVIFQDFLARPFSIDPPHSGMVSSASEITASLYCPASPAPPPVTALSLSSRPEFHFDPTLRPNKASQLVQVQHHHHQPASKVSSFGTPFESLACTSSLPSFGSKRFAEPDNSLGDRRNKRMIKNRESAARSRARKQEKIAYTNELQLKVDHLLEENARLKRQQQQLCEAAASQQKKKSNLYRTSTAPF